MSRAEEIKKKIDSIRKEQIKLENILAKQEDEGVYDESIYTNIDKLEKEYETLKNELESLEE